MDLWSRLIAGTGPAQAAASLSQQRLERLERISRDLVSCCEPGPKPRPSLLGKVRAHSKDLITLLHEDVRSPAPHLCLDVFIRSEIYKSVVQLATSFQDEIISRNAVLLFNGLVESDGDDDLLANPSFATDLMLFVDDLSEFSFFQEESEIQSDVLELLFNITAKIKLNRILLPAWFVPLREAVDDEETTMSNGSLSVSHHRGDFPLLFHLVGHVYKEGSGDFARTGLLYIVDLASQSTPLECWLMESDVFTLLASGLGALYSQLNRKLSLAQSSAERPAIIAVSYHLDTGQIQGMNSVDADDLHLKLRTFLSNLVFWQDLLQNCSSAVVTRRILRSFQLFFLEQILYPSILQSSDLDGGSSVAVLTYLWRILEAVDQPDLVQLILEYLLAIAEEHKSYDLEHAEERPLATERTGSIVPAFFSMVDLCLASLRSSNRETVTSALRLVNTITKKHHQYAYSTLLQTDHVSDNEIYRTLSVATQDVDSYLQFASNIGGAADMNETYENYLRDALAALESHGCPHQVRSLPNCDEDVVNPDVLDHGSRGRLRLVRLEDPLFHVLQQLLGSFFINDVETNLCLTNTITNLASCPYTRLEGWLSGHNGLDIHQDLIESDRNTGRTLNTGESSEEQRYNSFKRSLRGSQHSPNSTGCIYTILQGLATQLISVKSKIPNMTTKFAQCKEKLQRLLSYEDNNYPTLFERSVRRTSESLQSGQNTPQRRSETPQISPKKIRDPATPRNRMLTPMTSNTSLRAKSPSPSRRTSLVGSALTPLAKLFGMQRLSSSPTSTSKPLSPRPSFIFGRGNTFSTPLQNASTSLDPEQPSKWMVSFPDQSNEVVVREGQSPDDSTNGPCGELDNDERHNGEGLAREVGLDLILTNAVILQEFAIELAAIIHVRASYLDWEIRWL